MAPGSSTSASTWLRAFLLRQGRSQSSPPLPDGRPLYSYRCDDQEFATLQHTLRGSMLEPGQLATEVCASFCLYASEWWRRKYDGGPWSWQGIRQALQLKSFWRDSDVRGIAERGLDFWKRSVRKLGGHRLFLMTLASEGGLPLRLLHQEGAHLHAFFRQLLEELHPLGPDEEVAHQVASQLGFHLPRSFRHDEVYALSGRLATQVLDLQRAVADAPEPLVALDQRRPGWRSTLPLNLEDATAEALVRGLLSAAQSIAAGPGRHSIRCTTVLTRQSEALYILRREVRVPFIISDVNLRSLLQLDQAVLPANFQLLLELENGERIPLAMVTRWRSEKDRDQFIVETSREEALVLPDGSWSQYVRLVAVHNHRSLGTGILPGGEALGELPWLFVPERAEELETAPRWRLAAEGAASTRSSSCLVALRPAYHEATPPMVEIGSLPAGDRQLYELAGKVHVSSEGATCVLKAGGEQEQGSSFRWREAPQQMLRGSGFYIGCPTLLEEQPDGLERPVRSPLLEWRLRRGERNWRRMSEECVGEVDVRYAPQGRLCFQSILRILPRTSRIRLHASEARSGTVCLEGLEAPGAEGARVSVLATPGVQVQSELEGVAQVLHFQVQGTPPPEVSLDLRWKQGQSMRLGLPFPCVGARCIGRTGAALAPAEYVSLSLLAGHRIQVVAAQEGARYKLHGRLCHESHRALDAVLGLGVPLAEVAPGLHELELGSLSSMLAHCFSTTANRDVYIEFWLDGRGLKGRQPLLRVRRHDIKLKLHKREMQVELEDVPSTETGRSPDRFILEARLITQPSSKPVLLERMEGPRWAFPADKLEPGPWLILGREGEWFRVRPTLWTIPPRRGDQEPEPSPLVAAVLVRDETQRLKRLREVLKRLGHAPDDIDWQQLHGYLTSLTELPATTYDAVMQLIHEPEVCVLALLLHEGPLAPVWSGLESLPFRWSLVPACAWRRAFRVWQQYREQELATLPARYKEGYREETRSCLEEVRRIATFSNKGLQSLFDWLSAPGPRSPGLGKSMLELMDRAKIALVGTHSDEWWPQAADYRSDFEQPLAGLPPSLQGLLEIRGPQPGYCHAVLKAPIFSALAAAWGIDVSPRARLELRSFQDFDPSYFEFAYGCALTRALELTEQLAPERLQ